MYVCYHENNVPCRLSSQWLCGKSCTWAHDVLEISLVSYSYWLSQGVVLSFHPFIRDEGCKQPTLYMSNLEGTISYLLI